MWYEIPKWKTSLVVLYIDILCTFKDSKKSYGISCANINECNNQFGLTCQTVGEVNSCSNPNLQFCDCNRTINNENYWNGSYCKQAASFNQSCNPNITIDSSTCQTLTQGTICNSTGSLFTCKCPYLKYFDMASNKCENQLSFNQSCSNSNMCEMVLGLSCISGICE